MEKTKIEYCDSTLNIITGCHNTCPWCYARRTAERFKGCNASPTGITDSDVMVLEEPEYFTTKDGRQLKAVYPYGFVPTFHEYRLKDNQTRKLGETVFVGSMADCFGPWVPDEWIFKIFAYCKSMPGHRWLFLTKYPERYIELAKKGILPKGDEFWYGSTATGPNKPVFWSDEHNTFVSIEPILEPFGEYDGEMFFDKIDWIILGAETGKSKDKTVPKRTWIEVLVNKARRTDTPVFMKDSLKDVWGEDIITKLPWDKK